MKDELFEISLATEILSHQQKCLGGLLSLLGEVEFKDQGNHETALCQSLSSASDLAFKYADELEKLYKRIDRIRKGKEAPA